MDLSPSDDLAGPLVPAVALRRLEPGRGDPSGAPPYFLCLSAANTCAPPAASFPREPYETQGDRSLWQPAT